MFEFEKGLFNLTNLNEMAEDDVLQENADEQPTATEPVMEDTNISVPGGLGEKPSGAPSDQSVAIPSKTEISSETYNQAIGSLKKSFKEAAEILELLENVTVIQESEEQRLVREQNEYMENAISEAMLQSFENGPLFEAVQRDDKKEVKKIVGKVRSKVAKKLSESDIKFYKVNKILSILTGAGLGALSAGTAGASGAAAAGAAAVGAAAGSITTFWSTRLWQILGLVYLEGHTVKDVTKLLTDECKEELGEYKIVPLKTPEGLLGLFRTKFGWKNAKGAYMLLIDKKLTMEMKKAIKEVDDAVKDADKDSKDAKKPMNESEMEEFSDTMYELTESYAGYAYMEKCSKGDLADMKKELKDRKNQYDDEQKKDGEGCNCKKCKALKKSIDKLEKKIKKLEEE